MNTQQEPTLRKNRVFEAKLHELPVDKSLENFGHTWQEGDCLIEFRVTSVAFLFKYR